jgi:hypothetical protein
VKLRVGVLSRPKVTRRRIVQVSAHGKCFVDTLSNKIPLRLREGIMHKRVVETGSRNHIHYLAQHHSQPVKDKVGLWGTQRIMYGFDDDAFLRKPAAHFEQPRVEGTGKALLKDFLHSSRRLQ